MKRISILVPVLALLVISGCGASGDKLADNYDKDKILELANAEVEVINTMNYEDVVATLREDLQKDLTASALETAIGKQLNELGTFSECKDHQIAGAKGNDDYEYAQIAIKCKYANGSAIYTFVYDEDYALTGLFMK